MSTRNPYVKPAGLHGYVLAIAVTLAIFAVVGIALYVLMG